MSAFLDATTKPEAYRCAGHRSLMSNTNDTSARCTSKNFIYLRSYLMAMCSRLPTGRSQRLSTLPNSCELHQECCQASIHYDILRACTEPLDQRSRESWNICTSPIDRYPSKDEVHDKHWRESRTCYKVSKPVGAQGTVVIPGGTRGSWTP